MGDLSLFFFFCYCSFRCQRRNFAAITIDQGRDINDGAEKALLPRFLCFCHRFVLFVSILLCGEPLMDFFSILFRLNSSVNPGLESASFVGIWTKITTLISKFRKSRLLSDALRKVQVPQSKFSFGSFLDLESFFYNFAGR